MKLQSPMFGDHPLIRRDTRCWICERPFRVGQRSALILYHAPNHIRAVADAKPCHATCAYRGKLVETTKGPRVIESIRDGEGSIFVIRCTDGSQFTQDEVSSETENVR